MDELLAPRAGAPRRGVVALVALALIMMSLGAACSTSGDVTAGSTTSADGARAVLPVEVLEPAAYRAFLAANPDVAVVNVHVPYERHIAGTDAFVPFDVITEWDGLPSDRSTPVAIYCRSGNMSATASASLTAAGYTNIVDLAGGMTAWSAAGFDLVDNDPASG